MENEYILAMYDVRGKQDYIYNNPKIKQIAGASWIIRDCFDDYLFPAAKEVSEKGIFTYKNSNETENTEFTEEGFKKHIEDGYAGEVVYDGGGNFFVLFKNSEIYKEVNKKFYVKLLKETYTLRVLTSYIENVHFDDYQGDQKRLRDEHKKTEQRESISYPLNALPIVQVDNYSSLPATDEIELPNRSNKQKISKESKAKYDKYDELFKSEESHNSEKMLDNLIEEKGVDSHLAVIYIDGNSMGAKVEKITGNATNYEESIKIIRDFSSRIEKEYITEPIKEIDAFLNTNEGKEKNRRFVVYAGDEVTFICNAKHAYNVVKIYFDTIQRKNKGNSSCAGIAIFHSHSPYSEAYRIAEECCENGKKLMKKKEVGNACLMDFHYCQGAIGTSLDDIREHEGTAEFCNPWLLSYSENKMDVPNEELINEEPINEELINEIQDILQKIARSNGKTLLQAAKESASIYEMEIERIIAHCKDDTLKKTLAEKRDKLKKNRGLIYRMMLVYDLWFKGDADK